MEENKISGPLSVRIGTLTDYLWAASFDFITHTDLQNNVLVGTYFWTAFLYSIKDILCKHDIYDNVLNKYVVSVSYYYNIPIHEVETLASLKRFQQTALNALVDLNIDFSYQKSVYNILGLCEILCSPSEEDIPDDPPPLENLVEFMLGLSHLTKKVISLLSEPLPRVCLGNTGNLYTNSSNKVKTGSQPKSPNLHTPTVPPEPESESMKDVLFICILSALPIVLIILLLIYL